MQRFVEPPTVKTELMWAVSFLQKNNIENARLEGEVLLAHVLGWTRIQLLSRLTDVLAQERQSAFRRLVEKRAGNYPLQYLTGHQEFMSLDFTVNPHVLIPRDDTEILVQTVLNLKEKLPLDAKIVDVGTGSGIVAVSLKKYWPQAQVFAVDISPKALETARSNAQKHQVDVDFIQGDLLQPFLTGEKQISTGFDLIVSNPPYIPSQVIPGLQPEVNFEPLLALDGGEDGLDVYRRLIHESRQVLHKEGWLAVEIGSDQGAQVKELMEKYHYTKVQVIADYASLDRVVFGQVLH